MPRRPNIPCKHPGCAKLIPYGSYYCEEHKPMHTHDRESAGKRGYNTRWKKARLKFLHAHPLCEECRRNGKYVKATVVDHIKPHRGDITLFWDETNWQALCKPCHDKKTWREDKYPEYKF